jgi:hypothetical protein
MEAEKSPKSGKKIHKSSERRAQSLLDFEYRESNNRRSIGVAWTLTLCATGSFQHFVTGESRGKNPPRIMKGR